MASIIVSNYDFTPYAIVPEEKADERIQLALDTFKEQIELFRGNIKKYPKRDLYWQKQMDDAIDRFRAGFTAMTYESFARMQSIRSCM